MIHRKDELEEHLRVFAKAFLYQKEVTECEKVDTDEVLDALDAYGSASDELLNFIAEAYEPVELQLPRMDVFYRGETYNDFAYRLFMAASEAGQFQGDGEWQNYEMVYLGRLLRESSGRK